MQESQILPVTCSLQSHNSPDGDHVDLADLGTDEDGGHNDLDDLDDGGHDDLDDLNDGGNVATC